MSVRVLGIDPGIKGAVAVLDMNSWAVINVKVWDIPNYQVQKSGKNSTRIDPQGLRDLMYHIKSDLDVSIAYIEEVNAMRRPGQKVPQGVSSVFAFGKAAGAIEQSLADHYFSVTLVPPHVWVRDLKVKKGKDASRMRASQLYPNFSEEWKRVKDHNRAEAVLIASYGLREMARLSIDLQPPKSTVKRRRLRR